MDEVTPLTEYAARFRYPGAPWEPTLREAQESIELAQTFIHGYRLALPASMIVPKTQWNLGRRYTSGPRGSLRKESDCDRNPPRWRKLRAAQRTPLDLEQRAEVLDSVEKPKASLSKTAIKKAIGDGAQVPGADLIVGHKTLIRK